MRLIDADALFTAFENAGWHDNNDRDLVAEDILMDAPTIEAVPVVRGKWVKITTESLEVECTCSLCAGDAPAEYGRYTWLKTNFCPHCGARMDGDHLISADEFEYKLCAETQLSIEDMNTVLRLLRECRTVEGEDKG